MCNFYYDVIIRNKLLVYNTSGHLFVPDGRKALVEKTLFAANEFAAG